MAKKSNRTSTRRNRESAEIVSSSGRSASRGTDYKEILKEFASNPAVRYIAGGLATAFLTRIANNMSERYPEISSFIRENIGTLETKFGHMNGQMDGQEEAH